MKTWTLYVVSSSQSLHFCTSKLKTGMHFYDISAADDFQKTVAAPSYVLSCVLCFTITVSKRTSECIRSSIILCYIQH